RPQEVMRTLRDSDRSDVLSLDLAPDGHRSIIQPKKVPNLIRESSSGCGGWLKPVHHYRGILPWHRAELLKVLESWRLRQLQEELQGHPPDLEQQLKKCHHRLEEQEVAGPGPDPCPRFLQVWDRLQKMKLAEAGA
uniref:Uncharacterized protein n=1 Tax=Geospiza parvula TaxID=87175 RepID=A0A8C3MWZ0_GEOPR